MKTLYDSYRYPMLFVTSVFLFSILLIPFTVHAQSVAPVVHYELNETSGSQVLEIIHGFDGTVIGGSQWIGGVFAGGIDLDGSNDYISVSHEPEFNITGNMTISAWVKRDQLNEYGTILSKTDGQSAWDYDLFFHYENNTLAFYGDGMNPSMVISSEEVDDTTEWHHVALVREGSVVTFYIDGVSAGSSFMSGSFNKTIAPLEIGRDGNHSGGIGYYEGGLDDVRLYNSALSALDIRDLYDMGSETLPIINFTASPSEVVSGGLTTLSWATEHAQYCDANGDWDGVRPENGSEVISAITSPMTFVLSCHNSDGSTAAQVFVTLLDTTPPSIPSNLLVQTVTSSSVSFGWDSSTDDTSVLEYKIYRQGIFLDTTTITSYEDQSVLPDTTYSYTVSAVDPSGNESALSLPLSVTTSEAGLEFFPVTPILDDFNRPDQGPPPSSSWVNSLDPQFPGHQGITVVNNQAKGPNFTESHSSVWNTLFHQNQEVYYEFADTPGPAAGMGPALRMKDPTYLSSDQYIVFFYQLQIGSNDSVARLWKRQDGQWSNPASANLPKDLEAGDQMGLRAIDDVIIVYFNGEEVISFTDPNPLLGPGYTQLYIGDDTGHIADNFGGGSLDPLLPFCGDTIVQFLEQCDDGNLVNGDGCSNSCTIEGVFGEEGLVGYWSFNSETIIGNTVDDLSGEGNDGAIEGGKQSISGVIGEALNFDDNNNRVRISHDESLNLTESFTLASWINRSELLNYSPILSKHDGGSWDFDLFFSHSDNKLSFYAQGLSPNFVQSSNSLSQTGQWIHVAFSKDGSQGSFYIDGILDRSVSIDGSLNTNSLPVLIGSDGTHSGGIGYFSGGIDEVRIYDYALHPSEISQLAQQ